MIFLSYGFSVQILLLCGNTCNIKARKHNYGVDLSISHLGLLCSLAKLPALDRILKVLAVSTNVVLGINLVDYLTNIGMMI